MAETVTFTGEWGFSRLDPKHTDNAFVVGLTLLQYGNRVCGVWSEGDARHHLFSGNIVGIVRGTSLAVRRCTDTQPPYDCPALRPAVERLTLQQGRLHWYTLAEHGTYQRAHILQRLSPAPGPLEAYGSPEFVAVCRRGSPAALQWPAP